MQPDFEKQALNVYVGGGEKGCGHDGPRDRPAPNRAALRHRPAGLSVGTGLTGAMAAPAASRLPLASSNKFDQYGIQTSCMQNKRQRGPARRRWEGVTLRGSGGATPCQGAASRRRAGRPRGGRQKREARYCLFVTPPAGGHVFFLPTAEFAKARG